MEPTLGELGHYAGPATLILSSLADGPKHGYALMQDIETFSGVQLQPGTLYGAIQRLEQQGLILPMAEEGRRRPYRMTAQGATALQVQLKAQQQVSKVGLDRLSIGWSVA
jgi:DNA-binding PadR family transcriptional regulator